MKLLWNILAALAFIVGLWRIIHSTGYLGAVLLVIAAALMVRANREKSCK